MKALGIVFALGCGVAALSSTSCSDKTHSAPEAAGAGDASAAGTSAAGTSAAGTSAGTGASTADAGSSDGHAGSEHAGGAGGSPLSEGGSGGRDLTLGGAAGRDSATAGAPNNGGAADQEDQTDRDWALWPIPNPATAGLPQSANYVIPTGNLVVEDHVTGLMWQRNRDSMAFPVAGARAACRDLSYGGYDDWRLPTMIEAFSLLDWTHTNPAINMTAFYTASIGSIMLWTTTPSSTDPDGGAWVMELGSLFDESTYPVTDTFQKLCVRGGPAKPAGDHYVTDSDTVLDAYTGLTWERHPSFTEYTKEDAAAYCDALELGGKGDFRLPSLSETASLFDFKSTAGVRMDQVAFPTDGADVGNVEFWNAGGWTLSFWGIKIRKYNGTPTARVRCVR